jgi:CubicO group peptidase (beta-lactamase class C family)
MSAVIRWRSMGLVLSCWLLAASACGQSLGEYWETLPPNALVVMKDGRVVEEFGDIDRRIKQSSVRKSLLSAMYGIYVRDGTIDLDASLADIGIDDFPDVLTPDEREATVRMLLQARSGIYHNYIGGTPAMLASQPERNSHAPGSFWYYNNWDFNALGTIFEEAVGRRIGESFDSQIARPIGMQDFRASDVYYISGEQSEHRQYHFRMSARDLALFGELMRRDGEWNGRSIVPADWVAESTRSYSAARAGMGYGYLWWTQGDGTLFDGITLPAGSYAARGAAGKFLVIVPELGLVVAHVQYAEWPDNASELPDSELPGDDEVTSSSQMGELLQLIIASHSSSD